MRGLPGQWLISPSKQRPCQQLRAKYLERDLSTLPPGCDPCCSRAATIFVYDPKANLCTQHYRALRKAKSEAYHEPPE